MEFIDNLKKIFQNWRLFALVVWLLAGVVLIPYPNRYVTLVGIIIFFPFLVFLMFLFLLSLVSKRDIFEYPSWKIILFLVISLPIMIVISIVLVLLFVISVVTYFFFTSWFILYGCFLMGRNIDEQAFKTPKAKPFIRTLIFFGGLAISLGLLYLFIKAPTIFDFSVISEDPFIMPWYLNAAYLVVGGILILLAIIIIVYKFKGVFNGWFGIFAILVSAYTLFLVIKIYLGMTSTEENQVGPIWAYISMIVPDVLIIFYTLSTLMGSKAELLSKRMKRFGIDTVIIWLILAKVTYEFIHYFPYQLLNDIPFLGGIPLVQWIAGINNELINLIKNIAVLGFFVLLLIFIGIYEIRKYSKEVRQPEAEPKEVIEEPFPLQPSIDEPEPILEESKTIEDTDTFTSEVEKLDDNSNNEPKEDLTF